MRQKMTFLIFIFLFLGIPLIIIPISPVYAATTWNPPQQVTNNDLDDSKPVVVCDPIDPDISHLVWVRKMNASSASAEIMYSWVLTFGNCFYSRQEVRITNDYLQDRDPTIDVDASGIVHVAWVKRLPNSEYIIKYTNSTNWNVHLNFSGETSSTYYYNPTLVVEKETGVPHLVYHEAGIGPSEIYYQRSLSAARQQVTNIPFISQLPSMDLDQGNNAHIVWIDEWDDAV